MRGWSLNQPVSAPPHGPHLDPLINVMMGHQGGTLTTSTGTGDFKVYMPFDWTVTGVILGIATTADQDVIAQTYHDGTAMFSGGSEPTIASGSVNSGLFSTFASTYYTDFSSTQPFSMKLTQVGTSTASGSNLVATIMWRLR